MRSISTAVLVYSAALLFAAGLSCWTAATLLANAADSRDTWEGE